MLPMCWKENCTDFLLTLLIFYCFCTCMGDHRKSRHEIQTPGNRCGSHCWHGTYDSIEKRIWNLSFSANSILLHSCNCWRFFFLGGSLHVSDFPDDLCLPLIGHSSASHNRGWFFFGVETNVRWQEKWAKSACSWWNSHPNLWPCFFCS